MQRGAFDQDSAPQLASVSRFHTHMLVRAGKLAYSVGSCSVERMVFVEARV
ncbi:MAG: hypothetical protein K0R61_4684 [Microvirga sp.]|jgi:hypothetical protein|nr:hypothetical protein [Microvirga sp.]